MARANKAHAVGNSIFSIGTVGNPQGFSMVPVVKSMFSTDRVLARLVYRVAPDDVYVKLLFSVSIPIRSV